MHRTRRQFRLPWRHFATLSALLGCLIMTAYGTAQGSTDGARGLARSAGAPAPAASAPTAPATGSPGSGPHSPAVAAGVQQPPHRTNSAAVGPLFLPGQTTHFCTASVVDSPRGNVLLTAAHCLAGSGAGLRFIPGYGPSGTGPAGVWTVTGAYTDPAWLTDQDIQHDYAFLTVAPADNAGGAAVQSAVGSVGRVQGSSAAGRSVQLFGYTAGANDGPVSCSTRADSASGGEAAAPIVACPGFGTGTSGSPWVEPTPTGDQLVGLVGGLHQGGCSDDISNSPSFDAAVTDVLARASAGAPTDSLPAPGDDGC